MLRGYFSIIAHLAGVLPIEKQCGGGGIWTPRPSGYEPDELPLLHSAIYALQVGLEPTTSWLTVNCANRLRHWSKNANSNICWDGGDWTHMWPITLSTAYKAEGIHPMIIKITSYIYHVIFMLDLLSPHSFHYTAFGIPIDLNHVFATTRSFNCQFSIPQKHIKYVSPSDVTLFVFLFLLFPLCQWTRLFLKSFANILPIFQLDNYPESFSSFFNICSLFLPKKNCDAELFTVSSSQFWGYVVF